VGKIEISRAQGSLVLTLFFWQMSPNFHFFANNFKTAERRKLKFSHNVDIHQSYDVPNFGSPDHMTKFYGQKSKIES